MVKVFHSYNLYFLFILTSLEIQFFTACKRSVKILDNFKKRPRMVLRFIKLSLLIKILFQYFIIEDFFSLQSYGILFSCYSRPKHVM